MSYHFNLCQAETVSIQPIANYKTIKRDEAFQTLCHQFQKRSVSLYLSGTSDRTVKSKRKIEKDKVILVFPEKFFLKEATISQSPLLTYVKNIASLQIKYANNKSQGNQSEQSDASKISNINWNHLTSIMNGLIFYLIERRFMPNARLKPQSEEIQRIHESYIECLPSSYSFHPQNFMEDIQKYHPECYLTEKDYSQQFESTCQIIRKLIRNEYRLSFSFKAFLASIGKQGLHRSYECEFTRERIFWVLQVMRTRHYKEHGLVPLLDMFNHSCDGSRKTNALYTFNYATKCMEVRTIATVEKDDEILLSYSEQSNLQSYFFSYGFISEEEVCDLTVAFQYNHGEQYINLVSQKPNGPETSFYSHLIAILKKWIHERDEESDSLIQNWNMAVVNFLFQCEVKCKEKERTVDLLDEEIGRECNRDRINVLKSLRVINSTEAQFLTRIINEKVRLTDYFINS